MPDFARLASAIGVSFGNPGLLAEALTHRSYLNEHRDYAGAHNERLEFLGDAVLELAATAFLFRKFPRASEGELTSYRAALVNTASLAESGQEIGLNEYLLLSKGEAKDIGRAREVILADAFEAVIAALYLDAGYAAAEAFVAKRLFPKIDAVIAARAYQDAKSHFQELAQERRNTTPTYTTLAETGPDHARTFLVGIYIGSEEFGSGEGKSKQEAEQEAARAALEKTGW